MTNHTRRLARFSAVTAALAGAVLAAAGAGPAAAGPAQGKPTAPPTRASAPEGSVPAGFASWRDLLATQDRLLGAATRLDGLVSGRAGFTGIELSVPDKQVRLYWKGAVPTAVSDAAAGAAAGLGTRASVAVKPARYSRQQLDTAAAKLRSGASAAGVTRVAVPADGSGLDVGVRGTPAQARGSLAAVAGGVAVRVANDKAALPFYSRIDDVPPFWGGGREYNGRTGGQCSTGFAISDRANGQRAVLTAGHCANNGDVIYTGTRRYVIGVATGKNATADTLRLPANTAGRVYDGGVGVGEFSKPVAGAWDSFPGLWVCTSGSFSGARCNIVVRAVNEWINTTAGWMGPLSRAEEVNRQSAAGQGDSGGPVFALTPDYARMIAVGTISAGDVGSAGAPCTGVQGRLCSWRIWFADVADSLVRYNAAIVTG